MRRFHQHICTYTIIAFAVGNQIALNQAVTFESLPKIHVNELSVQEFDSLFLDQRPIILRGATTCPTNLNFGTIGQYCDGSVPGNYVKTRDPNAGQWAGLKSGDETDNIDFVDFVKSMGNSPVPKNASSKSHDNDDDNQNAEDNTDQKSKTSTNRHNLRFMFDVPMVELCPSLLNEIRIPPHLVDIFASQFLWRHLSDGDPKKCENVPFYNMYLAEGGFQTELHVDSAHTAFVASMCVGRKKWRIMTPRDHALVHSELSEPRTHTKQQEHGGNEIVGEQVATPPEGSTWVMSDIHKPFDTWTADSPLHTLQADVIVYEGILEPDEILYIPPGAPHAATTLEKSLMVASNDQSVQSLEQIVSYCDVIYDKWGGCSMCRTKLATVQENYARHTHETSSSVSSPQTEMTFAQSFDCEKAFDQLSQKRLELHPNHNFMEEIQKGPIVIMKYVRSCIRCVTLFNQLQLVAATHFDPPLRLGVLHCPHGHCPMPDDDNSTLDRKVYRKVLPMVRGECPEFVVVAPRNSAPTSAAAASTSAAAMRGTLDENHLPKSTAMSQHCITVSHYYGPLALHFLQVWISLKTGSTLVDHDDLGMEWWRKMVIVSCHAMMDMTVTILQACGVPPMAEDVVMMSVAIVLFFVVPLVGYCCSSATNKPKRKAE